MSATRKIDFINGAYSEIRINGLTVSPDAFETNKGLEILEDMAYEFFQSNIITEYNFQETPDVNDFTNTNPSLNRFFKVHLAVRLLNSFGKDAPENLAAQASATMSTAAGQSAMYLVEQVAYPDRMPVGAGIANRYRLWQRFQRPGAQPPAQSSTHQMYIGDINEFQESWESYLRSGETVSSYAITADPSLSLLSDSLSSPIITFMIEALSQQTSGNFQQVKIVVTTSLGRVDTRLINFNIQQAVTVGSIL